MDPFTSVSLKNFFNIQISSNKDPDQRAESGHSWTEYVIVHLKHVSCNYSHKK